MPIVFHCDQCNRRIAVDESKAGMRGACPSCKAAVTVPATSADHKQRAAPSKPVPAPSPAVGRQAAPSTPPAKLAKRAAAAVAPSASPPTAAAELSVPAMRPEVQQKILNGFTGPIERLKVPFRYKLGIAAAAALMVTLPIIYLAIIAAVGYLIYWHATENVAILGMARGGRAMVFLFLLYVAPIVSGVIIVLFMIKPIFARPAQKGRERSINETGEPLLCAFVNKICDIVGAPRPVRINVDYSVNASASFRRGMFSFLGHDLVLTIGIPLVAGLTLRQFAGVLAHEMGHFSQGAGMRVSYVTRSVNHWLTRVVYERDEFDAMLEEASENIDLRLAWVLWLARMGVLLSRMILWCLMMLGHFVSGFLLRQMEFDADRYEARVAGSENFALTSERLVLLSLAEQLSMYELMNMYPHRRLVDNWVELLQSKLDSLPEKMKQEVLQHHRTQATGWLATHPSDKDRIASAQRENAPGVFRLDGKCKLLFCHFDSLVKNVTWDMHCAFLGKSVNPNEMEPLAEIQQVAQIQDGIVRPEVDDSPIPFD